jgi:hypothetical protein
VRSCLILRGDRWLPEYDQRLHQILNDYLERPAGDYAELLRRGYVSSPDGADLEQWRAEIRAHARKDKIRIATRSDGTRAFAFRGPQTPEAEQLAELTHELTRAEQLRQLAHTARQLGHRPGPWLRHDTESITVCTRCTARIYARFEPRPISDGEALSESCLPTPMSR